MKKNELLTTLTLYVHVGCSIFYVGVVKTKRELFEG
jgi:hypothetical protein